jgi:DNA polymerase I-like protein with 3'-5' exonuclease and polymerase domains
MCTAPRIEDLDLKDVDTVAIDLETYDPNLKKHGSGAIRGDGFVCGIAIATDKQTLYFPIAHAMTENLDKEETWNELNELIFQNEKITKVFHNAMYDVCWIRSATKQMPKGKLIDTMIAASVLDETRMRYSLDSISKDYLNDSKYKYDLQEKSLSEFGIKDPMSNMHKLPYSLVKDYAEPKNYLKTHKNRFLRMIAKARECDKTNGAFVEGLLNFIHNGRIHADINQIRSDDGGTVTGRFSMSNPNLQQIPSKGYIGKKMRELFISEEGCKWGSFDYSQQEPRIVVHYALKLDLPGTDKLQEEFNKDDADFHQIVADMANIPRNTAKTINLGLFYGMGKLKLEKVINGKQEIVNGIMKL